eukprot:TRINITY_DN20166_c0_g1_i1.p1 TRINITY_DN20166_c0_g1~~TRINITY_DN20166_c0_g1_i1.p1  ORF type:complete len:292 (+),score=79.12 TRINITY_DN20166_c0_g1_i1:142-1017(+)
MCIRDSSRKLRSLNQAIVGTQRQPSRYLAAGFGMALTVASYHTACDPLSEAEVKQARAAMHQAVVSQAMSNKTQPPSESHEAEAFHQALVATRVMLSRLQDQRGFVTREALAGPDVPLEVRKLADLFWRSIDPHNTGEVSVVQFLFACATAAAPDSNKLTSFTALDADGDGVLSKDEVFIWVSYTLNKAVQGRRAGRISEEQRCFLARHHRAAKKLDKLHAEAESGGLTQNEFTAASETAVWGAVNAMFDKYDLNQDGVLQLQEFMKITNGELLPVAFLEIPDDLLKIAPL